MGIGYEAGFGWRVHNKDKDREIEIMDKITEYFPGIPDPLTNTLKVLKSLINGLNSIMDKEELKMMVRHWGQVIKSLSDVMVKNSSVSSEQVKVFLPACQEFQIVALQLKNKKEKGVLAVLKKKSKLIPQLMGELDRLMYSFSNNTYGGTSGFQVTSEIERWQTNFYLTIVELIQELTGEDN